MQLRDVMTRSVETVAADATLRYAATRMENENVGILPVMRDGRLVGIITDRDITVRAVSRGLSPEETFVEQAMTGDVVTLPENADLQDAAHLMDERKVRRLVVTDGQDAPVGMVTLDKLVPYVHVHASSGGRFSGEANEDTREFPVGFDPAAQAEGAGDTDTSIGEDPAVTGNDPSVTAEAEITVRDARDQGDPRKGPRSLMQDEGAKAGKKT